MVFDLEPEPGFAKRRNLNQEKTLREIENKNLMSFECLKNRSLQDPANPQRTYLINYLDFNRNNQITYVVGFERDERENTNLSFEWKNRTEVSIHLDYVLLKELKKTP